MRIGGYPVYRRNEVYINGLIIQTDSALETSSVRGLLHRIQPIHHQKSQEATLEALEGLLGELIPEPP